jgi:hypothetical protein
VDDDDEPQPKKKKPKVTKGADKRRRYTFKEKWVRKPHVAPQPELIRVVTFSGSDPAVRDWRSVQRNARKSLR